MDNKKKWLCYDFPFKLNVQESLLYDLFVLYIFAYCGISYVFASSIDQDSKQHGFEENKQEDWKQIEEIKRSENLHTFLSFIFMGVGDYNLVEVHRFFIKILCGCTFLLEQAKFHKAKVFNKFLFLCRHKFSCSWAGRVLQITAQKRGPTSEQRKEDIGKAGRCVWVEGNVKGTQWGMR